LAATTFIIATTISVRLSAVFDFLGTPESLELWSILVV
jgi:uncharacterized protein YndB with AHSA1/START domain